jgi:hypothetical protein
MNKNLSGLFKLKPQYMKTSILALIIVALYSCAGIAQINLVGAATNPNGGIDILKWEALDPESVETYPSMLTGYYMGSSAFNSYNSNYYLTGLTILSQGLYSFNTQTNQQELSPFSNFTNISDFDMSTGSLYDLRIDSTGYISINEFDVETGTDSLLGSIYEPGVDGLIADAIGFNANEGILYYVGFTYEPATYLYAIPVRDDSFSYSRTELILDSPGNLTSLNYDNVNDKLYALNMTFDSLWNFDGNFVVEIDYVTGEVVPRAELTEFIGFVASSSSFDQNTGSYLLVGIDTNYMGSMIVFDTYTNTYTTGFVPGNVSEIACDNTIFALNNYILTDIPEISVLGIEVYPNPASEMLFITSNSGIEGEYTLRVFSLSGGLSMEKTGYFNGRTEIDITNLAAGVYMMQLVSPGKVETRKLIIQ